ncbi:Ger(x)C family spore germination protein [Paenibacillus sp. A3M_27_13]|uniref:Ger(x)C family spore germination protein n=1 Tax=Paenibacillus sp. A3M_27_13 TaxID=2962029 RepID=UPI000F943F88|nr:Ger(x)C family spore germination protein [Paenibacillus sp. A3M_27_13]MCP3743950.1 Ger(x)C family spore germination protein [Paenibacillus sp. A3M_27_13]
MRTRISIGFCILAVILLAGCWDKAELVEFGYAQAIAVDLDQSEEIYLTTHFYNPSGSQEMGGAPKQSSKAFNILTKGDNMDEAIKDIPIHLGRRAKLDHMRILIIGEEMSRQRGLEDVLDFFMRDPETRKTILVLIARGKASDYLETKPYIENTIGQQLRKIEETTARFSAKTSRVPLLDLAIQLKNETGVTTLPNVFKDKPLDEISIAGVALLKEGKLVKSVISPTNTQPLLMLLGKFKSGVIDIADKDAESEKKKTKESLQVISLKTKIVPFIEGEDVVARVHIKIIGAIGELHSSSVMTREEQNKFKGRLEAEIKEKLRETISLLQKERLDAIGIGNQIFQKNSALWKRWKPTWNERFAKAEFNVAVEVNIVSTGMGIGVPF